MLKSVRVLFIGFVGLVTLGFIEAADNHLQCWHCSSDTIGAENFCDVQFKESNIPVDYIKDRNISILRSCNSTIHSDHERAVCRKTVEEANGKTITRRFCYYANKSDSLDYCSFEATDKNVRRVFCQDCLTTKCNSAAQFSMHMAYFITCLFIGIKNSII